MNDIERQILKNQVAMMRTIPHSKCIEDAMVDTEELLNPPKQQSIAERTHDALCESNEVKKDE